MRQQQNPTFKSRVLWRVACARARPWSIPANLRVRSAARRFPCGEAQTAVCPCEFLHKPEIAERHDKAALISVEKMVDLRLTDRLLKGDAGEHFERRGRESRFGLARVCSLKYAAKALLWTSVVRSETTPLIIRS